MDKEQEMQTGMQKENMFTETEVREILNRELSKVNNQDKIMQIRLACLNIAASAKDSDGGNLIDNTDKLLNYVIKGKK